MDDEQIEGLLRGYRLPEVAGDLDRRIVGEGAAIMARGRARATLQDIGRDLLNRLGFGYIAWLADVITTTDAEYRVDLI